MERIKDMEKMNKSQVTEEIVRTLSMEADSIAALPQQLDMEVVYDLVRRIASCPGRVVLTACGTSAMAARKIAHSLNCIECPAIFLTPSDAVHGALGVLQKDDLFILISKGGNTKELTCLLPAAQAKGAVVVAVSENPDSQLARAADVYLKVKVDREPCRFNMLATASTLAVIAAFDAICIALMQYTGYTREQFAIIHPAGAVGERLLGKEEGR